MLKKRIFRTVLPVLLSSVLLFSCARSVPYAKASDGGVSYEPTVFYARDGHVRFLYDGERDMLATIENYDMISLYDSGTYSLVITYNEGTVERKTADGRVREEFSAEGIMELSKRTKSAEISGCPFRRAEITCSDGSAGAVLYGNTGTGFAEIYYITAPDAPADTVSHVEELLSTVRFAEFTGDDTQNFTQVYAE